tara:strand:- start:250 stop:390 length:141 start_codon:yes stop_codon:yes gene_type:complete
LRYGGFVLFYPNFIQTFTMPQMAEKAKVLNGRGTVFCYSTGTQAGK